MRVVKSVDETGAGVYVPADGWGFKGTVSVSPPATSASAFRWLAPGVEEGPPPPAIVTTRPGVTSAGGKLEFGWRPFPIGAASKMVLAEAVTPGYHFVSAECTNNKPGGAAPTVTVDKAAATITVAGLSMNDDITCAVKNQKNIATIQIVKNTVGQPTEVALWVDGSTEPRKTGSGDFGTDPLTVSTGKHNVWETFIDNVAAALYRSTYSCTNGSKGSGTVVEGGVDLASGDNVTCTFTNTKTSPTVAVSKTASLPVLNEPGGQVQFTTTVVNTTDHPVTLTSLVDDVYGDLASNTGEHKWDSSDCATGALLDAYDGQSGGADTYTCHFVGQVSGEAGSTHMDTVTAEVTDPTGETATGKDTATVEIRDVKPSIQVTKAAEPSIIQDRGSVTFTAVVTNTSRVDTLHVDRLVDSIYGDLIRGPVKAELYPRRRCGSAAIRPPSRREHRVQLHGDGLDHPDRHDHRLGNRRRRKPRRRRRGRRGSRQHHAAALAWADPAADSGAPARTTAASPAAAARPAAHTRASRTTRPGSLEARPAARLPRHRRSRRGDL